MNKLDFKTISLLPVGQIRRQYTPEERNFIVMVYQKVKGTQSCSKKVTTQFLEKFPAARVPTHKAVRNMWKKQQTTILTARAHLVTHILGELPRTLLL